MAIIDINISLPQPCLAVPSETLSFQDLPSPVTSCSQLSQEQEKYAIPAKSWGVLMLEVKIWESSHMVAGGGAGGD